MRKHESPNQNTSDNDQQFLTVPQAAEACGIPAYKIRRAVKLGTLPSYGMLDRRRYVLVADIRAAMAAPIAQR